MKWTIKLVFEAVPGSPIEHELGIIERGDPTVAGEISAKRSLRACRTKS
jgi:hypothetical protein